MLVSRAPLTAAGVGTALAWSSAKAWGHLQRRPRWSRGGGTHLDVGLHVRTLGTGPPLVLLHGLLGSEAYWSAAYDQLAADHRLIIVDLRGFGRSPHPLAGYALDDHAESVLAAMAIVDVEREAEATIVAHSLGVPIALRIAQIAPSRVGNIIGFGPAIYRDDQSAFCKIGALGGLTRALAFDTPRARRLCRLMCSHRQIASHLAVIARPDIPAAIARATTSHTWPSYQQTVANVLLSGNGRHRIAGIDSSVTFVAGDTDRVVDRDFLRSLANDHRNVQLLTWPGGHDLPLRRANQCARLIRTVCCTLPFHR